MSTRRKRGTKVGTVSATRMARLLLMLAEERSGLTVAEMLAELRTSRASLYRALQAARRAGWQMVTSIGDDGPSVKRYRLLMPHRR